MKLEMKLLAFSEAVDPPLRYRPVRDCFHCTHVDFSPHSYSCNEYRFQRKSLNDSHHKFGACDYFEHGGKGVKKL